MSGFALFRFLDTLLTCSSSVHTRSSALDAKEVSCTFGEISGCLVSLSELKRAKALQGTNNYVCLTRSKIFEVLNVSCLLKSCPVSGH